MQVLVMSECYLNKCIAEMFVRDLKKENINIKIKHDRTQGRDRILKEVDNWVKKRRIEAEKLILIIDYEEGISRRYINAFFGNLDTLDKNIFVGRRGKIIGYVFDPYMEKVLGVNDDQFKSENACEILRRKLSNDERLNEKVSDIVKVLTKHFQELL